MIGIGPFMSETLAEYVTRVIHDKNLNESEVARRSKGGIAQSHINRIKNGEVTNPTPRKLQALAMGLGVPEEEVFDKVRGVDDSAASVVGELLNYVRALKPARQADLLQMAKLYYQEQQQQSVANGLRPVKIIMAENLGETPINPKLPKLKGTKSHAKRKGS
jgi:transcriptional regulator with XRE-family HTH domain